MKKAIILISAFLILLLILPYIPVNVHANQNVSFNNLKKPMLSKFAIDSSDGDPPSYYSFEAFQIKPPSTTPVVVPIAVNATFKQSGNIPEVFTVNIPKGNYSLAILNVSIQETGGPQYDRPIYVFANGIPLFWGSTQEIRNSTAQADVTYYLNLLQGSVTFQVVLTNYLAPNVGITGYYIVNVTLYLYPGKPLAGLPNYFIPLFVNPLGYSMTTLNPFVNLRSQTVTIPNGTYRMAAIFYTEGFQLDEFWYANEPAPRALQVYYNGYLAGIVLPYETIYTGGIDPFYWRPVTSINTLSFHSSHLIDLTPMLALGNQATISISMFNLETAYALNGVPFFRWGVSGALLLWVDPSNPLIGGKIISSKSSFLDSGPLFFFNPLGIIYQEVGSFFINNTSILNFAKGTLVSSVIQKGSFDSYQTFNTIFQYARLNEEYHEIASENGFYSAMIQYDIISPIELNFGFIAVPITNPSVIPYNVTFSQNGTVSLGLHYYGKLAYGNTSLELTQDERLYTYGGFSGILTIINPYGGAVIRAITSNFAKTTKQLTAIYTINGVGWKEVFVAIGSVKSASQRAGTLDYFSLQYFPVGTMYAQDSQAQKISNINTNYLIYKLEFFKRI
ncbi:MAG: peptide-N4-asparagine amidase [Thermoproteota archaeon]|jgi:hypothetical protein